MVAVSLPSAPSSPLSISSSTTATTTASTCHESDVYDVCNDDGHGRHHNHSHEDGQHGHDRTSRDAETVKKRTATSLSPRMRVRTMAATNVPSPRSPDPCCLSSNSVSNFFTGPGSPKRRHNREKQPQVMQQQTQQRRVALNWVLIAGLALMATCLNVRLTCTGTGSTWPPVQPTVAVSPSSLWLWSSDGGTAASLPQRPPPEEEQRCAINLYGLPRKFRHHVLPSLITNVFDVNRRHRCDYFVHFFNKTWEAAGRSGQGGPIIPTDVYLLTRFVGENSTVSYISDSDEDFFAERRDALDEILYNNRTAASASETGRNETNSSHAGDGGSNNDSNTNPYLTSQFDSQTTTNILRMWHSQTKVWELMEARAAARKVRYTRVAMLRLDVIYMTPIDVYRVPVNPIEPMVWGDREVRVAHPMHAENWTETPLEYFEDRDNKHAVIPGFAGYPVNDRFVAGPYDAVRVWAAGRWDRARNHVTKVLPALRLESWGLHDERVVAHSLLPDMMAAGGNGNITVHIDNEMYFLRVRADGNIWILDSPHIVHSDGRDPDNLAVERPKLIRLLNRNCTDVFPAKIMKRSPGRFLIKCRPTKQQRPQRRDGQGKDRQKQSPPAATGNSTGTASASNSSSAGVRVRQARERLAANKTKATTTAQA